MLTKSLYLISLQCPYWFYKQLHEPESLPEPDDFTKSLFETGYEVEKLANSLFQKDQLQKTFIYDDCETRVDVLNGTELIEIKSSTDVEPIHIEDLAFQRFILEKNNIKVTKCTVLHLNNEYIRKGELDLNQLFKQTDITKEVELLLDTVPEKIRKAKEIISGKCPKVTCTCKPAYSCPAHDQFFYSLPLGNVFELSRGKAKGFKLYEQGITLLKDVSNEVKLTDKQSLQIDCAKKNEVYFSKPHFTQFMSSLEYPLYHLDFEAIQPAIPQFDQSRPYQQICFQFSLHIQHEDGTVEHKDFLAEAKGDPRIKFANALEDYIDNTKGSIIVYNQSYEIGRLKELAIDFPEHKEWIEKTTPRIVDLLVPFRNFYYYNPSQQGSASIKKVLPALTGKDYSELEINNGGLASKSFAQLYTDKTDEAKIRENLLKYCCLDTEGMVWIINKIKELLI